MSGKSSRADNAGPLSVSNGGGNQATDWQQAQLLDRPQSCQKLGDFTSLRSATVDFKPTHHILSQNVPSKGSLQLGDLSKIVNQLRAREASPSPTKPYDAKVATPTTISLSSSSHDEATLALTSDSEGHSSSSLSRDAQTLTTTASSTPASFTTKPPQSRSAKPKAKSIKKRPSSASEQPSARISILKRQQQQQPSPSSSSQLARLFTYELPSKGVMVPVYDTARTAEEAHESLSRNLIPYCTADRHVAQNFPSNALHGVHIFLDMSNIEISFQKALRKRYSIADAARFTPLPRLNLRFLTELLVRGRSSKSLHVGCSILPGRKEPRYVQELRDLGYRADVRERKRIENGVLPTLSSSPSKSTAAATRYVEDLVDETLQTRIAEAVMEHFQEQGTIVLATGDAKPAQYSDGFLRYVERALRMGWNVELVAWHGSLSSSWRDAGWTAQWGEKFRVFELDSFIYDLLEIQS